MKSTINFIEQIYSQQCQQGDYIMLAVKGPDIKWKDVHLVYGKDIKKKLQTFFKKYPPSEYDLYWSPMPYSGPHRRLENAQDTKFLVQDIDEHSDPKGLEPQPSYIWESSPNKYQGLWELDRYISEKEYTPLNKALAKHIGCDDCFDYTHVYRIPGTINHKYKNKPRVELPDKTKKIYKPKNLQKVLNVSTKVEVDINPKDSNMSANMTERKIYAKYPIPQKVKDLLALESLNGIDRSSTIWYIENKLHELGMNPNEIIYLVKNSTFNKYKGRADEDKRLRQELDKIISGEISVQSDNNINSLKVSDFSTVMSNTNTFEGWLVKGFWGRRSHGIVAGMPKCFKSTLVHDLMISVASGKPFLGKFPVLDPGPVIVVQNENADYVMKDRTEKVLLHRNLVGKVVEKNTHKVYVEFPPELPIHFINQQGFLLTNLEHQQQLEKLIVEIKPVLVIFDPLYLMFDGDLNSAKDLNPTLNWLLKLKNDYRTSVMLIHHYNKGTAGVSKGGQRMMGSIFLYGWIESAWYLSKDEDEESQPQALDSNMEDSSKDPTTITMSREFRMSGSYPEIDISVQMGEISNPYYHVDISLAGEHKNIPKDGSIKTDIINLLKSSTVPVSARAIADSLGLSRNKAREIIDVLVAENKIFTDKQGFTVHRD